MKPPIPPVSCGQRPSSREVNPAVVCLVEDPRPLLPARNRADSRVVVGGVVAPSPRELWMLTGLRACWYIVGVASFGRAITCERRKYYTDRTTRKRYNNTCDVLCKTGGLSANGWGLCAIQYAHEGNVRSKKCVAQVLLLTSTDVCPLLVQVCTVEGCMRVYHRSASENNFWGITAYTCPMKLDRMQTKG